MNTRNVPEYCELRAIQLEKMNMETKVEKQSNRKLVSGKQSTGMCFRLKLKAALPT